MKGGGIKKKLISTKIWWETNTELKILWLCYQLNRIRDIPSVAVLWSEFRWFPSSISGSSNSSRQRFLSVWKKKKINQISHWKTNLRKWLANIGAIGLQKVAELLEMIYWARVLEVGGGPSFWWKSYEWKWVNYGNILSTKISTISIYKLSPGWNSGHPEKVQSIFRHTVNGE